MIIFRRKRKLREKGREEGNRHKVKTHVSVNNKKDPRGSHREVGINESIGGGGAEVRNMAQGGIEHLKILYIRNPLGVGGTSRKDKKGSLEVPFGQKTGRSQGR